MRDAFLSRNRAGNAGRPNACTIPTTGQCFQLHVCNPRCDAIAGSWANGDRRALDDLTPLVYKELRRLAASHLRRERKSQTLQPTALVHEAYLRLVDQKDPKWQNRSKDKNEERQQTLLPVVSQEREDEHEQRLREEVAGVSAGG